MELKLNVYEGKKIVKTYKSNDFMLSTGICEDIINAVDIDKLTSGQLNEQALGMEIVKIVLKSFSKFKPFMQNTFDGLTDEEYSKTNMLEVAKCVVSIVKYAVGELFNIGDNSKN